VKKLRLMCVLAHPDDESLGTGGTLARYAAEGVDAFLITATRGERGRFGDGGERPSADVVGKVRESELRAAATELDDRSGSDCRTSPSRQAARRHYLRT
jgi:LmbE family N-acetylglucosaminyl deacetylase